MNDGFLRDFQHPPSTHRGAPFWAWNGELEPDELRRQVRVFHRMGLGGFFMHSRVGLETPYLGEKWFECIDACLDEASKLGMQAWLYDEDRWPSGYAGGLVTKHPKNRQKVLVFDQLDTTRGLKWGKDVVAAFTARIDGQKASDVKPVKKGAKPRLKKGETLVVFRVEEAPMDPWWNGYTYLDTLSHDAVKAFIDSTHELYKKKIGKHFGKVVPGIFTDEPNTGVVLKSFPHQRAPESLPWTPRFLAAFKQRHGYDLRPRLMECIWDVEGVEMSHARWAYHEVRTHLFVDAFSRQISEWCGKNKLMHTGHVLLEETMADQTGVVGSSMRFYEHMQAPGMDLLTEFSRQIDGAKQVASVARQMGRTWRLTETYGCTGWDFPLAGHKAVGDWQAALGINLRCHHLSWYTMSGEAKRDYPASIFFQSPWWEWHAALEDQYARINVAMTKGTEVRDLLVLYPVESMWTKVRREWRWEKDVVDYNQTIMTLRDALLRENIDFDYGDEEMMERLSSVSKKGAAPTLRLGKAEYKAVVVPPMLTMRGSTLALLKKFAKAGGRVVFAGEAPAFVDAQASTAAVEFAATCPRVAPEGTDAAAAIDDLCRRVSITDKRGREVANTLHQLREDDEAFHLLVVNVDAAIAADERKPFNNVPLSKRGDAVEDARIALLEDTAGAPLELDPATGEVFAARAEKSGRGWVVHTSLPPIGTRLLVFPKKKQKGRLPAARPSLRVVSKAKVAPKSWDYALTEPNALVLDKAAWRIGGGKWEKPLEVLAIDRKVRDHLGILHRGGGMMQPWSIPKDKPARRVAVELKLEFEVEALPAGAVELALENPAACAVALNGALVDMDNEHGWWVDPAIRRVALDAALIKPGKNELYVCLEYGEHDAGLEMMYLLGQFGSKAGKGGTPVMTKLPPSLKLGDWTTQGLAFYTGNVVYRARVRAPRGKGKRLFLSVPDYRGAAVRVLVDGEPAGIVFTEPQEVDITALVKGPSAEVAIEVASSRRNAFGPLHMPEKWPYGVGPGNWMTHGTPQWTDDFVLVPCGLMKAPELLVKEAAK